MSKTLIIDLGSQSIKAGTLDDHIPSLITLPLIYNNFNSINFDSIIKNGIINNYSLFKKLLLKIFNHFEIIFENCNLFLSICDTFPNIDNLYRFLFDNFKLKNIYIGKQTSLSLYALSRTTGLLCNIGHDMVQIIPVYHGYFLEHLNKKLFLSGRKIDEQIILNLCSEKKDDIVLNYHNIWELKKNLEFLDLKSINDSSQTNISLLNNMYIKSLKLDNDLFINIDDCKHQCLDVLFDPKKFNLDVNSIAQEINLTLQSSDLTIRSDLMNNIIVLGGSTLNKGFEQRMNCELQKLNSNYGNIILDDNRRYLEWIGGKNLVSLDIFKGLWVSRDKYLKNEVNAPLFV